MRADFVTDFVRRPSGWFWMFFIFVYGFGVSVAWIFKGFGFVLGLRSGFLQSAPLRTHVLEFGPIDLEFGPIENSAFRIRPHSEFSFFSSAPFRFQFLHFGPIENSFFRVWLHVECSF